MLLCAFFFLIPHPIMAQFDSSIPENPAEQILQDRVCNLENCVTQVQGDNHRLVEQVRLLSEIARQPVHYYAPQNPTSADLHIPPPTPFNGAATTLPDFKIKLHNFLVAVLACMIQHLNNSSTLEISWQALLQSGTTPRLIPPLSTFPHPGTSRHFWPPLKLFWGGGLQPTPRNVTSGICVKPAPSQIWR